jgi:hypothetical protein
MITTNTANTVDRLMKLHDLLSAIPDEKFELDNWAKRSPTAMGLGRAKGKKVLDFTKAIQTDCGTTACACGWATTIPEFNALGFKMVDFHNGHSSANGMIEFEMDGVYSRGISAAALFFEIDYDDASNLFIPSNYPYGQRDRQDVMKRIRAFVVPIAARLPIPETPPENPDQKLKLTKIELKQSKTRLEALVDRIRKQTNKKFNQASIGTTHGISWSADEAKKVESVGDVSVGTTASALGLAGTMPAFRRLGFETVAHPGLGSQLNVRFTDPKGVKPVLTGFQAAASFFKLTYTEAKFLFDSSAYNPLYATKAYVIRRIEAHIKKIDKKLLVPSKK